MLLHAIIIIYYVFNGLTLQVRFLLLQRFTCNLHVDLQHILICETRGLHYVRNYR